METKDDFRKLFLEAVQFKMDEYGFEDAPLLLSGGVDSATILFALLELGEKPDCYTFQLGEYKSHDVQSAELLCKHFGLKHKIVKIPQNDEVLRQDITNILRITHDPGQIHVQVCHPFLYVPKALKEDGHDCAWIGLYSGLLYGSGREMAFVRHREGFEGWNAKRKSDWETMHDGQMYCVHRVSLHQGVQLFDPYDDQDLFDFCSVLDRPAFYRGEYKILPIMAFYEYFNQGPFVRPEGPYQVVSGIRAWHNTLLKDPIYKCKKVDVVYRKLLEEVDG